mmetsp:Transcript_37812/g.111948  ORF Transcript_37812/g.111948 Transcript_37812/m.111948 type:complete len:248 (-) Transcript_37812:204-947(-)
MRRAVSGRRARLRAQHRRRRRRDHMRTVVLSVRDNRARAAHLARRRRRRAGGAAAAANAVRSKREPGANAEQPSARRDHGEHHQESAAKHRPARSAAAAEIREQPRQWQGRVGHPHGQHAVSVAERKISQVGGACSAHKRRLRGREGVGKETKGGGRYGLHNGRRWQRHKSSATQGVREGAGNKGDVAIMGALVAMPRSSRDSEQVARVEGDIGHGSLNQDALAALRPPIGGGLQASVRQFPRWQVW